jgi:hypothetical protein
MVVPTPQVWSLYTGSPSGSGTRVGAAQRLGIPPSRTRTGSWQGTYSYHLAIGRYLRKRRVILCLSFCKYGGYTYRSFKIKEK